jgi:Heterokaryon incompatibility protein (HET)
LATCYYILEQYILTSPQKGPEDTTRRLRISGPINRTPGSERSFKLYRKWLRECQEHHKDCVQLKQSYLPKRLIRVTRDGETWHLGLQETCGLRKEAYVALSYCWGGDQPIKTTTETLDRWTDKIHMSDLPFTLQDAIVTTNELGLGFLWVDALCIMQDDPDEMAQEISQMPQIYEKASFVIVASRARSVREGFLKPREILHHLKPSCGLPFKDLESGDHGIMTLYQRPRLGPLPEGTGEPLDDRAWPLQERLLASRILEFGNFQTSWFCHQSKDHSLEGMYSDGWQEVSNDGRSAVGLQQELFALDYKAESSGASISAAQKNLIETWENLIGVYTSRKLSNTEDRSLAISGIAEKFASAFSDNYICGLWKLTFPWAILWRVLTPRRRPQSFQGPSWSWTSVNGSVSLDNLSSDEFVHHESHLELLHWNIKLAHEKAPFGGVICGRLWVKGLLRPAYLVYDQKLKICYLEGVGGPLHASFDKDCLEEVSMDNSDPTPIYLLSVISLPLSDRSEKYDAYGAKGLVLRALEKQKFSRLGLFQFARYRCEKMEHESEEECDNCAL